MDEDNRLEEAVAAAAAGDNDDAPRAAAHADNNHNNNNNIQDEEDERNQAGLPLIHSLEHYIRTRGIAPVDEQVQEADVFYADSHHARQREAEEAQYQEEVHRAAFAEYDMKEQDEKMSK